MSDSSNSVEVTNLAILKGWCEGQFALQQKSLDYLRTDLDKHIEETNDELNKRVSMEEFKPIRMMVYSTASTILLAVITAIVNIVLKGNG